MRWMALDFGSKTVGVAVTDELLMTAQGVEIIRRKSAGKLRQTLARIGELIEEYNPSLIVLGLPVNMDGSEGRRAELTREFADKLYKRFNIEIVFQDERLTTTEAYEIMDEVGISLDDREKYVDMIAAVVILEDYMHEKENNG